MRRAGFGCCNAPKHAQQTNETQHHGTLDAPVSEMKRNFTVLTEKQIPAQSVMGTIIPTERLICKALYLTLV